MLNFLPGPLLALIGIILYLVTALLLACFFFIVMAVWLITPIPKWRKGIKDMIFKIPSVWSETLRFTTWLTVRTKFNVSGVEQLNKQKSYLLICNHRGFLDILVLQIVFDRYIPQLRYFMKQALFWVPVIGQACYVLGYPFMKRYSKAQVKKNPALKNKDLDTTRKACQRFANTPITLINYVEGTRFTEAKKKKIRSPFQHLLRPKAGGIAFILSAMENQIDTVLNVTICYSASSKISWKFLAGKMHTIDVKVERIIIPAELRGDYQNDPDFRLHFQDWLNTVWQKKDQQIASTLAAIATKK